ncbi:sugar kinase [Aureibaculum sp. 2210JD6-5]|uniref:sugar kinase n=1 Tax=Aureibaculum sp. 2210JD6-5 TaxID=3103957 RepID=UPI002AAEA9EC|nr:sugar kinase [Aureibaculum sp. 2210JD6-5]MDY7394039.1 sugar kinase [Aureibaculum sp. 2210JD6-5]
MQKLVTFGEVLLRLSPQGNKKFRQTNLLEFYFGGTEVNVAISLANFGNKVKHISCISDDFVGDTAMAYLRNYNVQTREIIRSPRPLGIYYLEVGAVMRPSSISYNRSHSAFSEIQPAMVNWKRALNDCNWFHWTGITPGLSLGAYQTLKEGLKMAIEQGVTVSADPTYRRGLWKYGVEAKEALTELIKNSTIFIGGIDEINETLNTNYGYTNDEFEAASKALIETYPNITKVFEKLRTSVNASWHKIRARMWNGKEFKETVDFEITHIVDRIGTGDAFAAGLIYGLQHYDDFKAMEFASAACALKHTFEGDVNYATVSDVEHLLSGNTSGRLVR